MIKQSSLVIFLFSLLLACHHPNNHHSSAFQTESNFTYVNLIPDSLRTPEQKEFLKHLENVLITHIKIQNNHEIFTLKKEALPSFGIPVQYYDVILKNMRDNNRFLDKNGIKGIDTIWRNFMLEIHDSIK